ncbi:hypothetical protein BGZ79_008605 [Entomortierella chlamydospora]|nr:hypothetical protein BGZ79_008605 [Entomortierella chlamydospora]
MTLTGKSLFLAYDPDATISDLKKRIQTLERIPFNQQILVFANRWLEDARTLENYNITKNSVLYLLMRLVGGYSGTLPGVMFTDVLDTSGIRKYEFSASAPPGRVASPGANVECKCNCTKGYRVICQKGFGAIELSKEQFICPNCDQSNRITPVTVGFSECKYRFHGINASGQQYTSDWKVVKPEDCYQLFNPSNQTTWKRLVIESADFGYCEDCTICLEPLYYTKALESSKISFAAVAIFAAMSTATASLDNICYKDCMLNGPGDYDYCVSVCTN